MLYKLYYLINKNKIGFFKLSEEQKEYLNSQLTSYNEDQNRIGKQKN